MAVTTNLNITKLESAQAQKEVTTNTALDKLDLAVGAIDVSVAAGNVTLTEDQSRAPVIRLTGAPGAARVVTVDADVDRAILFLNATTGGFVIEVEYTSGTNFAVPAGGAVILLAAAVAHPISPLISVAFCAPVTGWTNMPAASTRFRGSPNRLPVDLTGYREARIIAEVGTAGVSGATLRGYYATTSGGAYAALDGATGPSTVIDTANTLFVSAWVTIAAGGRAPVFVEVYGDGGDGAVDPTFQHVTLQFR